MPGLTAPTGPTLPAERSPGPRDQGPGGVEGALQGLRGARRRAGVEPDALDDVAVGRGRRQRHLRAAEVEAEDEVSTHHGE
jgi:hypothetical protein